MNFAQVIIVAVRALLRNRMRSFLTMLGVIIGVGSVIAMTSIGAGARARVQKTFEEMGSNMILVHSGSSSSGGARGGAGTQPTITWTDLDAIREEAPAAKYASPLLATAAQVLAEGQNWATSAQGVATDFFTIRNWKVERGGLFSDDDLARGAKVALIGTTVRDNLFGASADPVGQIIRINYVPFEIVGVMAGKGRSGMGGDQDDAVFVPYTTFRAKLQGGLQQFVSGPLFIGAASREDAELAQEQIAAVLRRTHRIKEGAEDDFTVRNLSDIATAQQEGAATLTLLLAGIALVSLIVGGIGIMNIMLVSVTERTREIGLRMAVGARPRDILTQFMVESVTLSVAGGLFGVGIGVGSAYFLVARFDWPMLLQPGVMALSLGFSALVGVGFGLYPAVKASRLDPIEALRYE